MSAKGLGGEGEVGEAEEEEEEEEGEGGAASVGADAAGAVGVSSRTEGGAASGCIKRRRTASKAAACSIFAFACADC